MLEVQIRHSMARSRIVRQLSQDLGVSLRPRHNVERIAHGFFVRFTVPQDALKSSRVLMRRAVHQATAKDLEIVEQEELSVRRVSGPVCRNSVERFDASHGIATAVREECRYVELWTLVRETLIDANEGQVDLRSRKM